ncbi:hypothetical protein SAVIM40S_01226 [Streptomyces avidinii]|uniref:Uncharacterized protein n=1 Tax=Streptomyces avidinii TaxID=1895 RepID=A0ABS4KXP1_STRAV|nr:hypothetical protein [Streptomyces avidinii]
MPGHPRMRSGTGLEIQVKAQAQTSRALRRVGYGLSRCGVGVMSVFF